MYDRLDALVSAKADVIIVDTAHGHSAGVLRTLKDIKQAYPHIPVIAGNVATAAGTEALIERVLMLLRLVLALDLFVQLALLLVLGYLKLLLFTSLLK